MSSLSWKTAVDSIQRDDIALFIILMPNTNYQVISIHSLILRLGRAANYHGHHLPSYGLDSQLLLLESTTGVTASL